MAEFLHDAIKHLPYYRSMLNQDGAVRVPALLGRDHVVAIHEWLDMVIARGGGIPPSFGPEFESTAEQGIAIRKLRRLFWNDEPFWREIFTAAALPSIATSLIGAPVALTFHAAFLKPAKIGSYVALHQDQALWKYDYPEAINVWVALTPAHRDNGCLVGCRGSHRRGALFHRDIPEHPWHPGLDWDAEGLEKPISYELEPGDALIWNRFFVHGSGPNLSSNPRWGIVMAFINRTHPGLQTTDRIDF